MYVYKGVNYIVNMAKRVIKSVSIPVEMDEYLDEHPDLSLSKICQSKIIEIQQNRRLIFAETDRLKKHILFLNKKLEEAGEKLEGGEKK